MIGLFWPNLYQKLNNLLFLGLDEARATILGNLLCVGFEVVCKKKRSLKLFNYDVTERLS